MKRLRYIPQHRLTIDARSINIPPRLHQGFKNLQGLAQPYRDCNGSVFNTNAIVEEIPRYFWLFVVDGGDEAVLEVFWSSVPLEDLDATKVRTVETSPDATAEARVWRAEAVGIRPWTY